MKDRRIDIITGLLFWAAAAVAVFAHASQGVTTLWFVLGALFMALSILPRQRGIRSLR